MESKPNEAWRITIDFETFNRTSMESKQRQTPTHDPVPTLLIEPVWNRNRVKGESPGYYFVDF